MRSPARLPFVLLVLLAGGLAACAGEKVAAFKSGQYEQLLIAVDSRGGLTGCFREEQGEGVVKTCAIFLTGQGAGGEVPVVTWSDRILPGTLTAQKDRVILTIPQGREHAGCGLVLLPQISLGLMLERVAEAAWTELRLVTAARVYFHPTPDSNRVLAAFVVHGDVVGLLGQKGGWLEVEHRGRDGTMKGWIPEDCTTKLVPPRATP